MRITSRLSRFVLSAILVLGVLSVACGQSAPPPVPAEGPITLSLNSWVGWGPLFIAKEKGLFGSVPVDLRFMEDAGARRSAMISGSVDGYASSVDNLAIDATFGVTGKTVMFFDESAGADGIVAKRAVDWSNLKGRKVAVQKGLPGHFLLLTALSRHGLGPNDVSIVDMDADKAGSAFVGGSLDVAVTWEPWISKAAAMSGGKKLITTSELPGLIVDSLVIRDPVVSSRRVAVQKVVDGWFAALDWYRANASEGNAIIAKAYKLKPEEIADTVTGVRFYDKPMNQTFFGTTSQPGPAFDLFREAARLWQAAAVTTKSVPPEPYMDGSFVR